MNQRSARRPSGLRVFGFPVDVRPGFLILLGLFAFLYSGRGYPDTLGLPFGVWFAACIAGFTLCHELGHAFAARATGAKASIALDFLAGYASFEPTRKLKRWEKAGISVAGPAVQIVLGTVILLLMGSNPIDRSTIEPGRIESAIWWAGPVIGLINLAPVLPLDGGHIVQSGLDRIIPGRSRLVMIYFSIALTAGTLVIFTLTNRTLVSPLFFVFPLVVQIQMLQHRHTQAALEEHGSWHQWAASAERDAWVNGKLGTFPPGMTASPWFRASMLARGGRVEDARNLLLADLATVQAPNWLPPDAAPERDLAILVGLLPRPLPTGNQYSEYVLAAVLVRLGQFEQAGQYAAQSYGRVPQTMSAVIVAQAAAALGDNDLAVRWLRAAFDAGTNPAGLAEAIDRRSEFAAIRGEPAVMLLRHELMSAT